MKFQTIYDRVRQNIPAVINLDDAEIDANGGMLSTTLWTIYEQLEETASDEWEALMAWVLYQHMHVEATILIRYKETAEYRPIATLSGEAIQADYIEALRQEGYEAMLTEYTQANQ